MTVTAEKFPATRGSDAKEERSDGRGLTPDLLTICRRQRIMYVSRKEIPAEMFPKIKTESF